MGDRDGGRGKSTGISRDRGWHADRERSGVGVEVGEG